MFYLIKIILLRKRLKGSSKSKYIKEHYFAPKEMYQKRYINFVLNFFLENSLLEKQEFLVKIKIRKDKPSVTQSIMNKNE